MLDSSFNEYEQIEVQLFSVWETAELFNAVLLQTLNWCHRFAQK
jgi:hypothetical protein